MIINVYILDAHTHISSLKTRTFQDKFPKYSTYRNRIPDIAFIHISFIQDQRRPKIPKILGLCPKEKLAVFTTVRVNSQAPKPSCWLSKPSPKIALGNHDPNREIWRQHEAASSKPSLIQFI